MARIAGVDLPREKRVEIGFTYIYGIGRKTSNDILAATGINPDTRVKDLTEDEANAVVYREINEAQETLDTTPADRTEVIEECRLRMAVYAEFAPARMDEAAIREVIEATLAELGLDEPTAKDKGKLMKALMPKVKDKADGALVNRLVGTYLK